MWVVLSIVRRYMLDMRMSPVRHSFELIYKTETTHSLFYFEYSVAFERTIIQNNQQQKKMMYNYCSKTKQK